MCAVRVWSLPLKVSLQSFYWIVIKVLTVCCEFPGLLELQKYLKGVQTGNNEQSTMLPVQTNTVTKSTLQRTSPITTTPVSTQPTTTSCLSNFFCTTTCDNGYMTDVNGCPLCQCVQPGSSGIVTTNSPGIIFV